MEQNYYEQMQRGPSLDIIPMPFALYKNIPIKKIHIKTVKECFEFLHNKDRIFT